MTNPNHQQQHPGDGEDCSGCEGQQRQALREGADNEYPPGGGGAPRPADQIQPGKIADSHRRAQIAEADRSLAQDIAGKHREEIHVRERQHIHDHRDQGDSEDRLVMPHIADAIPNLGQWRRAGWRGRMRNRLA